MANRNARTKAATPRYYVYAHYFRGEGLSAMQRSTDRILTTHVGSLPRPSELIACPRAMRPPPHSSRRSVQPYATSSSSRRRVEWQLAAGKQVGDV